MCWPIRSRETLLLVVWLCLLKPIPVKKGNFHIHFLSCRFGLTNKEIFSILKISRSWSFISSLTVTLLPKTFPFNVSLTLDATQREQWAVRKCSRTANGLDKGFAFAVTSRLDKDGTFHSEPSASLISPPNETDYNEPGWNPDNPHPLLFLNAHPFSR